MDLQVVLLHHKVEHYSLTYMKIIEKELEIFCDS